MAQSATCAACGRVCKSKNALREVLTNELASAHQRCHNKKYFCHDGQCGRKEPPVAFGTKRDLIRHQRTHTTNSKLRCHYCHAVVGRVDNLKRHIDTIHKGGLCMAAASGDEEAVMSCLVVDTGSAQEKDPNGDTPLFIAVASGHEGVVRILLDTGFLVGTECPADDPRPVALWLAQVHDRHDIAKLLISRGVAIDLRNGTRPQVLLRAAQERNLQLARRCLEVGVTIEVTDSMGWTALRWAVENRDEEMTKLLIANGAFVNDSSLLVAAAKWVHVEVFSVLLEETREPGRDSFREILLGSESQVLNARISYIWRFGNG
ncbi:ankyrin repeat-containing domain protein [Chaetomium tenue]|uniref:Ankyrin repeat-containing domain protein n=1 Tax=Chaetomium tenue TaxID=1854479 RepID=A0ACB7NXT6_9PEZI|nr:ankyrin repeat-containing domain protein [Chaetomium globosum]